MNARLARMLRSERDSTSSSDGSIKSAGRPARRSGSSKRRAWHVRAIQHEPEQKCWTQADWGLGFEPRNEVPYTSAAEKAALDGTAKRYALDDRRANNPNNTEPLDADLLELDMADGWGDVLPGEGKEELVPEVAIQTASPTRRRAVETSPRYRAAARHAVRNGTPSPTTQNELTPLPPVGQVVDGNDAGVVHHAVHAHHTAEVPAVVHHPAQHVRKLSHTEDTLRCPPVRNAHHAHHHALGSEGSVSPDTGLDPAGTPTWASSGDRLDEMDARTQFGHLDTDRLQHYIHTLCAEHKEGGGANAGVSSFWTHFGAWVVSGAAPMSTKMGTLEWSPSQTLGWLQLLRIDPTVLQTYLIMTDGAADWTEGFIVEQLLNGVNAGLLRLGYSLHCLDCDACIHYGHTLRSIPPESVCGVCGKPVRALLNDSVAAHFKLVRDFYNCPEAGSPGGSYEAISRWEVFAMDVPPRGVYESQGYFECCGDYLVLSLFTARQICVVVSGEHAAENQIIELHITENGIRPEWISVAPGPFVMRAVSDRSDMVLLTVVPAEASLSLPPAASPLRFSAYQLMHHAPWYTKWEPMEYVARPLLTGSCACLVADISGLGLLCSRVGDLAALTLIRSVRSILRRAALRNGGRCLRVLGSRSMLSFSHPGAALACALQTLMEACPNGPHRRQHSVGDSMALKIGVHAGHGCWLSGGGDEGEGQGPELFGGSVATCTAVCTAARPNSIALHSDTFSLPACQDLLRAVEGIEGHTSTIKSPWATASGSTEHAADGLHIDCKTRLSLLDGTTGQQTIHLLQLPGLYLYTDDEQS